MNNSTTKYTERQPSSDAREEFLAVMEYLFEFAYDEKHLSRNKDIIKFAHDKYGIYFRKERVCGILIHLEQMYNDNPERFPFKLNVRRYKNSSKYYITNRIFTDLETIDIITALRSDRSKSQAKVSKLEAKILNRVAGSEKQSILENKLNKTLSRTPHISVSDDIVLSKLKVASQSKMYISFKLGLWYEFEISNNWPEISKEIVEEKTLNGYVHSVLYFNKGPWVVIYLAYYKAAIVAPIESIELISGPDDFGKNIDFSLNNKKYSNVDKWIEDLYRGKTSTQTNYLLGIVSSETSKLENSFESYFGLPLNPINKTLGYIDFHGKKIVCKKEFDYVEVTCNPASLNNWIVSEKEILFNATIIEPQNTQFGFDEFLVKRILSKRKQLGLSNKKIIEEVTKFK